MISDVMFEAVEGLDQYLNDSLYDSVYSGDLRARVLAVLAAMKALQGELDAAPPGAADSVQAAHADRIIRQTLTSALKALDEGRLAYQTKSTETA
jgi:hypothetical protein